MRDELALLMRSNGSCRSWPRPPHSPRLADLSRTCLSGSSLMLVGLAAGRPAQLWAVAFEDGRQALSWSRIKG